MSWNNKLFLKRKINFFFQGNTQTFCILKNIIRINYYCSLTSICLQATVGTYWAKTHKFSTLHILNVKKNYNNLRQKKGKEVFLNKKTKATFVMFLSSTVWYKSMRARRLHVFTSDLQGGNCHLSQSCPCSRLERMLSIYPDEMSNR